MIETLRERTGTIDTGQVNAAPTPARIAAARAKTAETGLAALCTIR